MGTFGLNLSDVVNVQVTISPLAVPRRNFGIPLFVGSSEVIDTYERIRQYSSLDQVGEDFLTTQDEYIAAKAFFGQNPQPNRAYIGRWAQTATPAILYGGILSPAQQLISNFTGVTTGALTIFVNGVPKTISAVNWSTQTNLNGIANIFQTQYQSGSGDASATFQWLAGQGRFKLTSGTTGVTSLLSWAQAPTAWTSITFGGNPTASDTLTINGTVVTFVSGTPTGNQVQIGATAANTIQNLLTFLDGSTDANIILFNYSYVGSVVYVVSKVTGTTGNTYTLAKSSTNLTLGNLSGSNLQGGSGADISGLLALSSAASAPAPVNGIAAETAAANAQLLANMSHQWYFIDYVTSTQPTLSDLEAVSTFIESASPSRIHGYTTGDTTVLDANTSADIASAMKTLNLARTMGQYSTTAKTYAVASLFGRIATVDFTQNNSTITLKFKREPGIVAETLTETQAATVDNKSINVFVEYDEDINIVQQGKMANGDFIDERVGADWFQNALQVALFNVLYTTPTKIPQTDAGTVILTNACKAVCKQAVTNGFCAPGVWNGPPFGQLNTGDTLPTGFYVYAPPVSSQSQSDREARKSVPIQIALKLAGAVHSINCTVWVNR